MFKLKIAPTWFSDDFVCFKYTRNGVFWHTIKCCKNPFLNSLNYNYEFGTLTYPLDDGNFEYEKEKFSTYEKVKAFEAAEYQEYIEKQKEWENQRENNIDRKRKLYIKINMEKHFANDLTDKTNQVLVVSSDESEITVGNDFKYDTVGNSFTYKDLKYSPSSVNFTTATHVYADYNCEIFKNSADVLRLKYVDESDADVIVEPKDLKKELIEFLEYIKEERTDSYGQLEVCDTGDELDPTIENVVDHYLTSVRK